MWAMVSAASRLQSPLDFRVVVDMFHRESDTTVDDAEQFQFCKNIVQTCPV
ncbi:hypothetical protein GGI1_08306 [Acidithiobacillus sp. GGI-221]|nr:hypothetical protein GGI1_08306 [Acidithiobacillus sp. GGI-221]